MGKQQFYVPTVVYSRGDMTVLLHSVNEILNVGIGETYLINIYAPASSIAYTQILNGGVTAITGASTGSHRLSFNSNGIGFLYGATAHNKALNFSYGAWNSAVDNALPSDNVASSILSREIMFTESESFGISYKNESDVISTANVSFNLIYKKQVIS